MFKFENDFYLVFSKIYWLNFKDNVSIIIIICLKIKLKFGLLNYRKNNLIDKLKIYIVIFILNIKCLYGIDFYNLLIYLKKIN